MFHDLCKAIEAVAPAGARRRSEAEVARFAHAAFAHNRAQDVHGRDREVDRVLSLCTDGVVSPAHGAASTPEPASECDLPAREVLVAGEPGVGKSSILACVFTVRTAPNVVSAPNAHTCHWCQKLEERNAHRMKEFRGTAHAAATQVAHARRRGRLQSNTAAAAVPHHVELPPAVIAHFVGVAPGSDNLRPILQRLVQELRYVHAADTCTCGLSDTTQPCLVWPQCCLETRYSDAP